MAAIEPHSEGSVVRVRLQPRAARAEIAGELDGRLRLRVTAPPVDGEANAAACRFLSKTLGLSHSSVTLIRGAKSREKDFLARGVSAEIVARALEIHGMKGQDR